MQSPLDITQGNYVEISQEWTSAPRSQQTFCPQNLELFLFPVTGKAVLKVGPNLRPLIINYAVPYGSTFSTIRHNSFISDDAFLDRTNTENGSLRALIQYISRKLNANTLQLLKGVPQQ